ncbi:MAG: type II toxin-antitoxin system VapC family toxin [Candidatus Marinimicrobia bacterium]|nr:type II toxin-antitoxin system VapC family toxin [Candidatus Neomarinimicrobiota bacterium]
MSVLDASVVLKWFVLESDSDKAESLRSQYYLGQRELVVPDLILYEIPNALKFHPDFSSTEIKQVIQTLFDIDMEIITPTQMLINKAIDIASENNVTFYDATYFALAKDLKMDFITADEKFYNKLIQNGLKNVVLLKNLKT